MTSWQPRNCARCVSKIARATKRSNVYSTFVFADPGSSVKSVRDALKYRHHRDEGLRADDARLPSTRSTSARISLSRIFSAAILCELAVVWMAHRPMHAYPVSSRWCDAMISNMRSASGNLNSRLKLSIIHLHP